MYESTITMHGDADYIEKLFEAEEKDLGRASYTISRVQENIIFHIKAHDATALKMALNTITKILIVWEKTKNIASQGNDE